MSIIHEALKKVQASFQKNPPAETPPPQANPNPSPASIYDTPTPVPEAAPAKVSIFVPIFQFILTLAFLVGAGLFAYTQVEKYWPEIKKTFSLPDNAKLPKLALPKFSISTKPTPKPQPPKPLAQVVITPATATTPASVTATAAPAQPAPVETILNIQGVISNGNSTAALINDKIYEAGDEIAGIKILQIESSAITILRDGKEEIIKVRR